MTWKIRHQGSPRSIEGLKLHQVVEGLQDELWEATDEVMGPLDDRWVPIESHPQLAEVVLEIEPAPPPAHEEETSLDMNPLIDLALVLLIFFMLTTTYDALQKVLEMPNLTVDQENNLPTHTDKQVDTFMVQVQAREQNGKPVIMVEQKPVDEKFLAPAIQAYIRGPKTDVLIDSDGKVPWGTIIAIRDAAKQAGAKHLFEKANKNLLHGGPAQPGR